jgi:hypothetical protein
VLPLLLLTPGRINKTVAATDDALAQRKQAEHDAAVAAAMAAAQAARQRLRAKKHRKKDEVTRHLLSYSYTYMCIWTCIYYANTVLKACNTVQC